MAPQTAANPLNTQIYEEAADWLVRNREHTLGEAAKKSFDLWLRASPEHIRAYLELSALWEDFSLLDPAADAASAELSARFGTQNNIVPLECRWEASRPPPGTSAGTEPLQQRTTARPLSWRFGVAASILVLVAATALLAWMSRDPSYSTAVGEQRTIRLPDGSAIELNSASRVDVHFTEQQRTVELVRGQALFQVAKDRARPFIVSAGSTRVRAVGTQFDVYQKRVATVVTVLEGQVAVLPLPAIPAGALQRGKPSGGPPAERSGTAFKGDRNEKPASLVLLSAGQQLTVTRNEVKETPRADLAAATAWTQHHIVFIDSPLNEVAEEFNRYNTRHLVIADRDLDSFRINGVFSSVDPAVLLRFLRQQSDIEIEETDTTIRISHR